MDYLLAVIIGYLFGSFPTGYILLKRKGIDITEKGSGNMGALNSYEVTNSKITGIAVLVLDFLKGFLAVLAMKFIFPGAFIFPAIALIFAVLSHNYNPWLKFKGGRGLATAAGGTSILFPFVLILWLLTWMISYLIKKDIHFANIWGTIFSFVIVLSSSSVAVKYSYPAASEEGIIFFTIALIILIFLKHIDPLIDLIESKKIFSKGKR
jgi:acyl phosphate:glycerol-3-phosphate acyltransferase